MVDLGAYKDKFGESGQRILEHALSESRQRDQNYVAVEHILEALMHEEPDLFNSTMRELSLDPIVVKFAIDKRLETSRPQHVGKGFRIAPDTTDLFKRAMERARAQGRKTIEATDIFEALTSYDSLFVEVLRSMGANAEAVAHQRAETKIIAFTGFAYPHIAQELFPKLRVPTGIYHNSVQVPDKSCGLNRSMQHHLI